MKSANFVFKIKLRYVVFRRRNFTSLKLTLVHIWLSLYDVVKSELMTCSVLAQQQLNEDGVSDNPSYSA